MNALVAALLLAALPFPAPRVATVTDATKFDPGVVVSMDPVKAELRVKCAAGIVTFKVAADVPVFDLAGKSLGAPAVLAVGQKVRVWYVIDHGARALEIAVE
jgi:phage baseplate assembly protein gpV